MDPAKFPHAKFNVTDGDKPKSTQLGSFYIPPHHFSTSTTAEQQSKEFLEPFLQICNQTISQAGHFFASESCKR